MRTPMIMLLAAGAAACGSEAGNTVANAPAVDLTAAGAGAGPAWPDSLKPFGDGYPNPGDPCRRVGESAATSDFLDDSADLVGCPSKKDADALKGKLLQEVEGITLVSVPRGDANAGLPEPTAAADPIRGKGGAEEKCLAQVAQTTGATVIGTNRIVEGGDQVEILVNVEGAQAPWRCLADKKGAISRVEYSESEGAL